MKHTKHFVMDCKRKITDAILELEKKTGHAIDRVGVQIATTRPTYAEPKPRTVVQGIDITLMGQRGQE